MLDSIGSAMPPSSHAHRVPAGQAGGMQRGSGPHRPDSSEGAAPSLRSGAQLLWIVIHHRADDGARVRYGIRDAGWTPFWPRLIIRHPRRDDVLRPMFPGYMFASRPPGADSYGAILRIPNVIGILGVREFGSPTPAPTAVIEALIQASGGIDGMIDATPDRRLSPGQAVRITTGPLAGFHGLYQSDRGQDRVRVLLTLMGRDVPHDVPRDAVVAT